MVVGSLASSFHGEPRQTRDIDIVVEADPDGLRRFRESLDEDEFYSDAAAMLEAVDRRTSFNIVDATSCETSSESWRRSATRWITHTLNVGSAHSAWTTLGRPRTRC
jgi:hypothetical protein